MPRPRPLPLPHRQHGLAVAGALLVTVLWSSSWVLIRVGLDDADLPPLTFAALRYGVAAAILLVWTVSRPGPRHAVTTLPRAALGRLAVYGVVFIAMTQGAQFVAIDNQPAATTSLMLSLTPLAIAALGSTTLGERPSTSQAVGAVLVAAGAFTYFAGDLGVTTIGMVAALIALGANATATMMGRSLNRSQAVQPVVIATTSMAVGSLLLGATAVVTEPVPHLGLQAWALIVWLALVNTALAFTLWSWSQRHLTAVETAGINNTMLVQIGVLGWLFLDEPLGLLGTAGILVVTVGVLLTQLPAAVGRTWQDATGAPTRRLRS